jgi:hypothetical protein
MEWYQIAMLFEFMFIGAIMYSFREQIISRIYGVRYKRWIELDTGRYGYTILDKSLDHCKIMGQTKTISRKNILHGILYFVNDNVENLKLEPDNNKWLAYCNSEEFDTVYKNKLLEQLMLIMERNWIIMILIVSIITLGMVGYMAYMMNQYAGQLTYLVGKVNEYATIIGTTQ